jgi:hypothetical protein
MTGGPDLRVLGTCKQIYVEGVLLPFAQNTFYFYATPEAMAKWRKNLAKPQEAAIEKVNVFCFDAQAFPLQNLSGLTLIVQHSPFCGASDCYSRFSDEDLRKSAKNDRLKVFDDWSYT